jgi:hypothetical protein
MDNRIEAHHTLVQTLHQMSRNIASKSFGDFREGSARICHLHRRYNELVE